MNIHFEGKVYRDGIDITSSEAYELLRKAPDHFSTSPGSPGEYLQVYQEVSKSAKEILCIALSSKVSTLYNMARVAKKMAEKELPGTTVEVVDSETVVGAEGLIVLAAARAAAEGKNLKEIIDLVEKAKERTSFVGIFETIRHVYRTGRIPKIASQVGSLLSVKPLITISDGAVHMAGFARAKRRGVERMLEIMKEKAGKNPIRVFVLHADALEEAERLKEQILSEFNCIEVWINYFSPVLGYSTGPRALIIGYQLEPAYLL